MDKICNIVIAGIGGQGVLSATDILAEVLVKSGLDVKKSELHGMSQRGGSVSSDVRFGKKVHSPMVPTFDADYLIVFSDDQIENNKYKLKKDGVLITSKDIQIEKLKNKKSLNVALLGVLNTYLQIPENYWFSTIKSTFKENLHETNIFAFNFGQNSNK